MMGAIEEPGLAMFGKPADGPQDKWTAERVLSIRYWTPTLVTVRTTRYRGFRFTPGHYTRLGLGAAGASVGDWVWRDEMADIPKRELSADAKATLSYLPIVTREPGATRLTERIPLLLADGRLEDAAACPLDVAKSGVLVCGNPEMTRELRQTLAARGFATNRRGVRGQMALEKYW